MVDSTWEQSQRLGCRVALLLRCTLITVACFLGVLTGGTNAATPLMSFDMSFSASPIPGGTVSITYRLQNHTPYYLTNIFFTHDLNATLPGLAAVNTPMAAVGGNVSGTTLISATGLAIGPQESAFIELQLLVPAGATPASYLSTTSNLEIGSIFQTIAAARATLVVSAPPATIPVNRNEALGNGDWLLEIGSDPGATYRVDYSPDLVTWTVAASGITATGILLQWTDSGPPATASHPSSVANRFYRITRTSP